VCVCLWRACVCVVYRSTPRQAHALCARVWVSGCRVKDLGQMHALCARLLGLKPQEAQQPEALQPEAQQRLAKAECAEYARTPASAQMWRASAQMSGSRRRGRVGGGGGKSEEGEADT